MGVGGTGSHAVQHERGAFRSLSLANGGDKGETTASRDFEQDGLCKHAVSVEANTCPPCRLPQNVAGVGDLDDSGPSSAVDTLEKDMEKVYNTQSHRSGDATVQSPREGMS